MRKFAFCIWLRGEGNDAAEAWKNAMEHVAMDTLDDFRPALTIHHDMPVDAAELMDSRTAYAIDEGDEEGKAPDYTSYIGPLRKNVLGRWVICDPKKGKLVLTSGDRFQIRGAPGMPWFSTRMEYDHSMKDYYAVDWGAILEGSEARTVEVT